MSAPFAASLPTDASLEVLATAVGRVEHDKERVVLTRGGEPVAALVPFEDIALLEAIEDEQDIADAHAALAEWEAAGRPPGPTLEELAARHGVRLDPDAE